MEHNHWGKNVKKSWRALFGFVFSIDVYNAEFSRNQKEWNQMFRRLCSYKEEEGNCDIPAIYPDDLGLACWARTQRTRVIHGKSLFLFDSIVSKILALLGHLLRSNWINRWTIWGAINWSMVIANYQMLTRQVTVRILDIEFEELYVKRVVEQKTLSLVLRR